MAEASGASAPRASAASRAAQRPRARSPEAQAASKRARRESEGPGVDGEDLAATEASTTGKSQVIDEETTGKGVGATDDKENAAAQGVGDKEKMMDGAPEGELFLVNVLAAGEFQPSNELEKELRELEELLERIESKQQGEDEVSWGKMYGAVDSVRRLAIHHTQEIQQRLSRALTLLVLPSVSSLRSAMSRNAVLCVEDLIRALPTDISAHFDSIIPLLIQRACNEKQFIRDAAREVLDTAIQQISSESLLKALLQASGDKNPQAVSVAGVYSAKCIQSMDKEHLKTFVSETHQTFLKEMAAFLNCKIVECKVHARRALQYTRKTIGDTEFVAKAKEQLTGGDQFDVLRASEERKKPAGPKGRPSIRERMMQMKKAKGLPAGGNSGDNVPVVVVAAPPPPALAAASSPSSTGLSSSL